MLLPWFFVLGSMCYVRYMIGNTNAYHSNLPQAGLCHRADKPSAWQSLIPDGVYFEPWVFRPYEYLSLIWREMSFYMLGLSRISTGLRKIRASFADRH